MVLGSVTRWPNVGEDYHDEMAQVKFIVRRESDDWRSIKIYSATNVSLNRLFWDQLADFHLQC